MGHCMKKVIISTLAFLAFDTFADAPLSKPEIFRVCDKTVTYCASLNPEEGTTVYRIEAPFKPKEMYKVSSWSRSATLSEDGEYLIIGYSGLNLVPKDVKPSEVMFTIWKNGVKHKEINLGQIIGKWSSLEETASHYKWGGIRYLIRENLFLDTVEGSVVINVETGEVKRYKK